MGRAGAVRKHCMSWLVGVLSHSAAPLRLIGDGCIFTVRRPRGPPAELDDDASQALRCGGPLSRSTRSFSPLANPRGGERICRFVWQKCFRRHREHTQRPGSV